jgi:hypothetical protein
MAVCDYEVGLLYRVNLICGLHRNLVILNRFSFKVRVNDVQNYEVNVYFDQYFNME